MVMMFQQVSTCFKNHECPRCLSTALWFPGVTDVSVKRGKRKRSVSAQTPGSSLKAGLRTLVSLRRFWIIKVGSAGFGETTLERKSFPVNAVAL